MNSNTTIDHYVWKGYYLPDEYGDTSDEILATTKEKAMELTAEHADVENENWVQNDMVGYPLYQRDDTQHHVVTVTREPVYGDDTE